MEDEDKTDVEVRTRIYLLLRESVMVVLRRYLATNSDRDGTIRADSGCIRL